VTATHCTSPTPAVRLIIQASANFIPGTLDDYPADSIYLGIGTLGKHPDSFKDDYWNAVVASTAARTVIPIHWNNFTVGLHKALRPLPAFFDDVPASLTYLRARAHDVTLAPPILGQLVDPFGPPTMTLTDAHNREYACATVALIAKLNKRWTVAVICLLAVYPQNCGSARSCTRLPECPARCCPRPCASLSRTAWSCAVQNKHGLHVCTTVSATSGSHWSRS
jgi:hypothetical protein